jgi:flagellar basal-body rod modification protein FlgD
MSPSSIASTNPVVAASNTSSNQTTTPPTGDTVTKNMFLQLLVAQIKNQDPLNPTDGVQFLTQLAQFQQLEQSMNMGQDMSAVRSDLDKIVQLDTTTQDAGTQTAATN